MSDYIDIYIDTTTKGPEDATEFDYELFERFMSGGPWVAHSEYMKLKDDNAKLRKEIESVGTAAYLYGRSDLKAENAKLREEIEAAKHDLSIFSGRIVELDADNAKLRELVADLWMQLLNAYDRKEVDEFADRMRELGVEVTDG